MMQAGRFLSDLRIAECRKAASEVLRSFRVETPEAIDLGTIAWHLGKLRIKVGGLAGAEGRLVATPEHGGVIRVAAGSNEGRRRFTIGHEIGHFMLHQGANIDRTTLAKDFTIWTRASEEAEANYFAAELLMPEFLIKGRCAGKPTIEKMDGIATEFRTSLMATTLQFWQYTSEPLAVVVSDGWQMAWFRPFKENWPRIRFGEIHEDSAAGERLSGKADDSRGMVRSPAYAWLDGFERSHSDIMEDSIYLEAYNKTLTLLWIDQPL